MLITSEWASALNGLQLPTYQSSQNKIQQILKALSTYSTQPASPQGCQESHAAFKNQSFLILYGSLECLSTSTWGYIACKVTVQGPWPKATLRA